MSTGDATVFGKIAKLTATPKADLTPLEKEVLNFVLVITALMAAMVVVVIIIWYTALSYDNLLALILEQGRLLAQRASWVD